MKTRTETQLRAEPRESAELKVLRRNKVKGFKAKSESARPPGPRSKKRHKIDVLCEEVRLPRLPAVVEPPGRDPMIRVYSEDSAYVDTQVQSGPLSLLQTFLAGAKVSVMSVPFAVLLWHDNWFPCTERIYYLP